MDYAAESLKLHYEWQGKIEVTLRAPLETADDLSLAYTPGVAQPCLEIQKDVSKSYDLTRRGNLVAVITDGTAVLGLGDIGPEAGMPVMEGKCALFKRFGNVDAIPLCVRSKDVDEIVNTVRLLAGSFAGRWAETERLPAWMYKRRAPFFTWVGKHTLPIYLFHQPVAYALFALAAAVI